MKRVYSFIWIDSFYVPERKISDKIHFSLGILLMYYTFILFDAIFRVQILVNFIVGFINKGICFFINIPYRIF